MKYKLRSIVQPKALTFYLKNKTIDYSATYTFADNHPNFQKAKTWLEDVSGTDLYQDRGRIEDVKYAELRKLYDVALAINSWSDGDLQITRTGTLYKGSPVPNALSDFLVKAFFADPTNENAFKAWSNYLGAVTDPNLSSKIIDRLFNNQYFAFCFGHNGYRNGCSVYVNSNRIFYEHYVPYYIFHGN